MVQKIILTFIHILLGLIGWMPFPLLKWWVCLIHFILFRVLNYRKDVTQLNLLYALPDLPSEDILKIEKKFYIHLSELVVEIIKGFFAPIERIQGRIHLTQKSKVLIQSSNVQDRNVVLLTSHYGNWELPLYLAPLYFSQKIFALYLPLSFKPLDTYMKNKREKLGATLLDATKIKEEIHQVHQQKSFVALVADQSPTGRKNIHVSRLLAMDTPFFTGAERLSKELNAIVMYAHIRKKGFFSYEIEVEILTDKPNEEPQGHIIEKYAKALESDITDEPQYWIWSHKRWKGSISY